MQSNEFLSPSYYYKFIIIKGRVKRTVVRVAYQTSGAGTSKVGAGSGSGSGSGSGAGLC